VTALLLPREGRSPALHGKGTQSGDTAWAIGGTYLVN
jgi:hypothetical protein